MIVPASAPLSILLSLRSTTGYGLRPFRGEDLRRDPMVATHGLSCNLPPSDPLPTGDVRPQRLVVRLVRHQLHIVDPRMAAHLLHLLQEFLILLQVHRPQPVRVDQNAVCVEFQAAK